MSIQFSDTQKGIFNPDTSEATRGAAARLVQLDTFEMAYTGVNETPYLGISRIDDAEHYTTIETDAQTESMAGSGNLNFQQLQSAMMDDAAEKADGWSMNGSDGFLGATQGAGGPAFGAAPQTVAGDILTQANSDMNDFDAFSAEGYIGFPFLNMAAPAAQPVPAASTSTPAATSTRGSAQSIQSSNTSSEITNTNTGGSHTSTNTTTNTTETNNNTTVNNVTNNNSTTINNNNSTTHNVYNETNNTTVNNNNNTTTVNNESNIVNVELPDVATPVSNVINNVVNNTFTTVNEVTTDITNNVTNIVENILDLGGDVVNNTGDNVTNIIGDVTDVTSDITTIVEHVLQVTDNTVNDVLQIINNILPDTPVPDMAGIVDDIIGLGGGETDTDLALGGSLAEILPVPLTEVTFNLVEDLAGDIDIGADVSLGLLGNGTPDAAGAADISLQTGIEIIDQGVLDNTLGLQADPLENILGDIDINLSVAGDILGGIAPALLDSNAGGADTVLAPAGDLLAGVAGGITGGLLPAAPAETDADISIPLNIDTLDGLGIENALAVDLDLVEGLTGDIDISLPVDISLLEGEQILDLNLDGLPQDIIESGIEDTVHTLLDVVVSPGDVLQDLPLADIVTDIPATDIFADPAGLIETLLNTVTTVEDTALGVIDDLLPLTGGATQILDDVTGHLLPESPLCGVDPGGVVDPLTTNLFDGLLSPWTEPVSDGITDTLTGDALGMTVAQIGQAVETIVPDAISTVSGVTDAAAGTIVGGLGHVLGGDSGGAPVLGGLLGGGSGGGHSGGGHSGSGLFGGRGLFG